MRLFTRTLLSYIAVIILLAGLTGLIVTDTMGRDQSEDVWRELKSEGTIVFDNFNSWKRALWKTVVGLQERGDIAQSMEALGPADGTSANARRRLYESIRNFCVGSGADFLLLRAPNAADDAEIQNLRGVDQEAPDSKEFEVSKPHPYIEVSSLRRYSALVGVVRLWADNVPSAARLDAAPKSGYLDVFVVKIIDQDLLNRLTFNPRIKVLVYSGDNAGGNRMMPVGDKGLDFLIPHFEEGAQESGYASYDSLKQNHSEFDALVQSSGTISIGGLTGPNPVAAQKSQAILKVATFYSIDEYLRRIESIRASVMLVSLVGAAIAILVSLFLSGTITAPIRGLLRAMRRIESGDYELGPDKLPRRGVAEIKRLTGGFEQMADRLARDRQEMDLYVREIVGLKEYNERILHGIREAIVVLDDQLRVEKANQAFLKFSGHREDTIIGHDLASLKLDIADDSLLDSARKIIGAEKDGESRITRDGEGRAYEIKLYRLPGERPRCIVIIEDVEEKLLLEQQIYRAEKLATMSILSAGVAHEINNPLASILTNVQNLIAEDPNPERVETLRLMEAETKRITRIVRDLLDFSASGIRQGELEGADSARVIEDLVRLAAYSVRKERGIELRFDIDSDPDCPRVALSDDELKQVMINLINNSLQAFKGGGTITIRLIHRPGGERVAVIVEDSGSGIPERILRRVFDPFFTTKDSGTGMGLSVVYGILTKHGGTATIESEEGKGTTVRLDIPVWRPKPGG